MRYDHSRSCLLRIIVLCLAGAMAWLSPLSAQSIDLYGIDASSFPTVRASFFAYDQQGAQYRPTAAELTLKEDGVARTITSVTCPPGPPPRAISATLVMDVSASMGRLLKGEFRGMYQTNVVLDIAKKAAQAWVDALPLGKSECALVTFDHLNYLQQDFTTDRTLISEAIWRMLWDGGTDYNAALISPAAGGLLISQRGRFERVLVMLTDGLSEPPDETAIIDEARRQSCPVFIVTLGMSAPNTLKRIAAATGGEYFEDVTTVQQAEAVYRMILAKVQGSEPCQITWQSVETCKAESRNVDLEWRDTGSQVSYRPPGSALARLEFDPPPAYRFKDPPIGIELTQSVTVTAREASITVSNISSSNPAYSLTPTSFTLQPNESRVLTLRHRASDSGLTFCQFTFTTNLCEQSYYATAGYRGKRPKQPTLKLTHPNGDEMFVVGSDTVVTWEGVAPSDTVHLDLSTDNGASWRLLARNTTGLSYPWTKIPRPASPRCRIRVRQGEYPANYDPSIPSLRMPFARTYGGFNLDVAHSICATRDGSAVVAGATRSDDVDLSGQRTGTQNADAWIVKLDQSGSIQWQKIIGGTSDDWAHSIIELLDGSFVVAGLTDRMGYDFWVAKLSADGDLLWQIPLGGTDRDVAYSVAEMRDGSLAVAGVARSNNRDVTAKRGGENNNDIWVVRLDTDGNMLWQKTIGGSNDDWAESIAATSDGGLVVTGLTASTDLDVVNKRGGVGNTDVFVVKLDAAGRQLWQKTLGGTDDDGAESVIETDDGSLVIAGWTESGDLDVTGKRGAVNVRDGWIVKLDAAGRLLWQRALGGSLTDEFRSIKQSVDGSYIASGLTASNDFDIKGKRTGAGNPDFWVVNIEPSGKLVWQRTVGGTLSDEASSVTELFDGSIMIAGMTVSNDVDVVGKIGIPGTQDFWVVKLEVADFTLQSDDSDKPFAIVEPLARSRDIDMGQVVVGAARDSVIKDLVYNAGSYPFTVTDISFRGTNAAAFALVSGEPEYTVAPKDTAFGELKFRPTVVGLNRAEIVIVTQSDTLIQTVRGIGVQPSVQLSSRIIDFGKVTVNRAKDTLQVATIKNVSSVPLQITAIRHGQPNTIDFTSIQGGEPVTIQPNETHRMDLRFLPRAVGRTSGTLRFDFNGTGSPAIVQLFGEGVLPGPGITAAASTVVLRCAADTVGEVIVRNTGTDTLRITSSTITGPEASEYRLLSPLPVAVAEGDSVRLSYQLRSTGFGLRRADLVLVTNVTANDSIYTIPLQVRVENVNVSFDRDTVDLGDVDASTMVDTSVVLMNTGTITTTFGMKATGGLEVLGNSSLVANSSSVVALRIKTSGQSSAIAEQVVVTDSICGRSDTLVIIGRSVVPDTVRVIVYLPDITARAGETIPLALLLKNADRLSFEGAPVNFTSTIALNPNVVHVTDPSLTCQQVDANTCRYVLTGRRTGDSVLMQIPAMATLGNTDRSPLQIISFDWLDSLVAADVTTRDGSIMLTDICEEGGVRLFVPGGAKFSLATRPNPASSTMELHYGLAEPTDVNIRIVDYTGQTVLTPVQEPLLQPGAYVRSVDVSALAPGPYIVVLTSANISLQTRMDVVR